MSFAYVCHHNTFLVYESLKNNTFSRWKTVTAISIGSSYLVMMMVGILGYTTYYGLTQGNILNSLPQTAMIASLARIAGAIVLSLTYPIECFVARTAIEAAFFAKREPSKWRHVAITILLVSVTTSLGLFVDDLGFTLELTGGFSAVGLAYIMPALCSLRLDEGKIYSCRKLLALLLFVFGIVAMFASTGLTLYNALS